MLLQPRLELARLQWPRVGPSDGESHQPLVVRRGRRPKHADVLSTVRPLLHRLAGIVRCRRRRVQEASTAPVCGQNPRLPRKDRSRVRHSPSTQDRRQRGRSRVFGCSRQIRSWERHLPRSVAFPARDHPQRFFLEPRRNRLDRESRQIRRQQFRAMDVRRTYEHRPKRGTVRDALHSVAA